MKRAIPRIAEPDDRRVHFTGPPMLDIVTLCGWTDFTHDKKEGRITRQPVTCRACIEIARFVYGHRKEHGL